MSPASPKRAEHRRRLRL